MDANSVLEALKTRRSIRRFKPEIPEQELIDKIIEAGVWAPTGKGLQSPLIVEVTNKEVRDYLSKLNAKVLGTPDADPFYGAPVVLVVLADRSVNTHVYDGSLVMGNMMIEAHALGLGSCWIHRAREVFDSAEGKALLKEWGVEGDYEGVGHCVIGYKAHEAPAPKARKEGYVIRID